MADEPKRCVATGAADNTGDVSGGASSAATAAVAAAFFSVVDRVDRVVEEEEEAAVVVVCVRVRECACGWVRWRLSKAGARTW